MKRGEGDERSNRYVYKIKNLSCTNCALKIEQKISELDNVQVNLDLINNRLIISTSLENKRYFKKVNKIAKYRTRNKN